MQYTRRRLLGLIGIGAAIGMPGCLHGEDDAMMNDSSTDDEGTMENDSMMDDGSMENESMNSMENNSGG